MISQRAPRVAFILVLGVIAAACSAAKEVEVKPVDPVYFPPAEVCQYPGSGLAKTFRNLGGGTWSSSNPSDPAVPYECVGAKRTVQMFNDSGAVIEIEFYATGVQEGSSMISLSYSSTGGPILNETTYRNVFANLAENISKQGLKAPPPELFRKKLSNLASYSEPGKGFAESFDVGPGFISLTREASADRLNISVSVRFYPDIALKLNQ